MCVCVCCHKWPLLFTRLFENKTQHCSPSPHACSSLYNYATRNACLMCSLTVRETSYIFMIYEKSEVLTETNTEHYLWVEWRRKKTLACAQSPSQIPAIALKSYFKRVNYSSDLEINSCFHLCSNHSQLLSERWQFSFFLLVQRTRLSRFPLKWSFLFSPHNYTKAKLQRNLRQCLLNLPLQDRIAVHGRCNLPSTVNTIWLMLRTATQPILKSAEGWQADRQPCHTRLIQSLVHSGLSKDCWRRATWGSSFMITVTVWKM